MSERNAHLDERSVTIIMWGYNVLLVLTTLTGVFCIWRGVSEGNLGDIGGGLLLLALAVYGWLKRPPRHVPKTPNAT